MTQPNAAEWRRSSRCESGTCVEVRTAGEDLHLRNSTDPERTLAFSGDAWSQFRLGVIAGEFDLPE